MTSLDEQVDPDRAADRDVDLVRGRHPQRRVVVVDTGCPTTTDCRSPGCAADRRARSVSMARPVTTRRERGARAGRRRVTPVATATWRRVAVRWPTMCRAGRGGSRRQVAPAATRSTPPAQTTVHHARPEVADHAPACDPAGCETDWRCGSHLPPSARVTAATAATPAAPPTGRRCAPGPRSPSSGRHRLDVGDELPDLLRR